jgi:hypothetical protein
MLKGALSTLPENDRRALRKRAEAQADIIRENDMLAAFDNG